MGLKTVKGTEIEKGEDYERDECEVSVASALSVDGAPFVRLQIGGFIVVLATDEARGIGQALIEAALTAELDTGVVEYHIEQGLGKESGYALVRELRKKRFERNEKGHGRGT